MPILKDAKREIFCQVLVQTNKRTKAAIAAGYGEKNARNTAYRIMQEPEVLARVEELRAAQFQALQMETDEILGRLAAQARGDVRMLWDEEGNPRPVHDLNTEEAACIQEVIETVTPQGKGKPPLITRKIKLRDPTQALRMLAQHKRLIGGDIEDAVTTMANAAASFADRMVAARKRRTAGQ